MRASTLTDPVGRLNFAPGPDQPAYEEAPETRHGLLRSDTPSSFV